MLYQKLRIFAVMAVALAGLSAAAHFNCDDLAGPIICRVTVGGERFIYSPDSELGSCTSNYDYCVDSVSGNPGDASWEIHVTNNGDDCWAGCPVQNNARCDDFTCWDTCDTNAC